MQLEDIFRTTTGLQLAVLGCKKVDTVVLQKAVIGRRPQLARTRAISGSSARQIFLEVVPAVRVQLCFVLAAT